MGQDSRQLVGRWIHVHEEDDGSHRVFRRADAPLPPSRGRAELEVMGDMTVRQTRPGLADRPVGVAATRIGFGPPPAGSGSYLRAAAVDAERLLVAKD